MKEIWNDIKWRFKQGDILTRLLYVNIGVFFISVLLGIVWMLVTGEPYDSITDFFTRYFALPLNSFEHFLLKPHTLITNMFLHVDFLHLFWNMLILYFLGKMFLNYFSSKQLFGLYILGGLMGGIALLIITNISPYFNDQIPALGASAAVMAIVIGVVSYTPKTTVNLFGVFPVKILWIGIIFVASDLINFSDKNAGGHLAHLVGAGTGYWFGSAYKRGKDITFKINRYIGKISSLFTRKGKMKVVYNQSKVRQMSDEEYNASEKVTQAEIDAILDKISESGYSSLTKREKDILFQYSNKKK